jgi:hypothetical protein
MHFASEKEIKRQKELINLIFETSQKNGFTTDELRTATALMLAGAIYLMEPSNPNAEKEAVFLIKENVRNYKRWLDSPN